MREEINTKAGLLSWFKNTLIKPVDGTILGFFRIVFGVFMIIEMIKYINMDLVKNAYILPVVKLPYFEFIKALPEPVMKLMLAIMLICAILIAAGVFFRYAGITFGSFYLYFFLLEKSIYNNHIYLFITLAFLLPFL